MFKGYRTYILAGVGCIAAVANYFVGDAGAEETIRYVFEALIAMTIRSGIKNAGK